MQEIILNGIPAVQLSYIVNKYVAISNICLKSLGVRSEAKRIMSSFSAFWILILLARQHPADRSLWKGPWWLCAGEGRTTLLWREDDLGHASIPPTPPSADVAEGNPVCVSSEVMHLENSTPAGTGGEGLRGRMRLIQFPFHFPLPLTGKMTPACAASKCWNPSCLLAVPMHSLWWIERGECIPVLNLDGPLRWICT